ncbi:MAG TPA: hypothetical protein VIV60_15710 [Polyangiaceae bacterium]
MTAKIPAHSPIGLELPLERQRSAAANQNISVFSHSVETGGTDRVGCGLSESQPRLATEALVAGNIEAGLLGQFESAL